MNRKEFMSQKASEMTGFELCKATRFKLEEELMQKSIIVEKPVEKTIEKLSFAKEIQQFPDRFKRFTGEGWVIVKIDDGVSYYNTTKILNTDWNSHVLDDVVFYVEFKDDAGESYKELVRRIKK